MEFIPAFVQSREFYTFCNLKVIQMCCLIMLLKYFITHFIVSSCIGACQIQINSLIGWSELRCIVRLDKTLLVRQTFLLKYA